MSGLVVAGGVDSQFADVKARRLQGTGQEIGSQSFAGAPTGKRQLITSGYLKASHRELDERTTEGNPYHPHTRSVPVEPGQVEEYVLRLYPFANTFKPGHRSRLVLPFTTRGSSRYESSVR